MANVDVVEMMKRMTEEMRGMRESIEFMNEKFESTMKELIEAKEEKQQMQNYVISMNERIKLLEVKVQTMSNQGLQKNLELSGMPCKPGENCDNLALSVIKKVLPSVRQDDIEHAYRIGNPKSPDGEMRIYRPSSNSTGSPQLSLSTEENAHECGHGGDGNLQQEGAIVREREPVSRIKSSFGRSQFP